MLEPANKSIKADYEELLLKVKPPQSKPTKIETLNEPSKKEEPIQKNYTVSIEEIGVASDYNESLDWRAEPEISIQKKKQLIQETESVTEIAQESLVENNLESPESTTESLITKLQSIIRHEPKSVPKSMFEFERDWKSLQKAPKELLNYLEHIPLDRYPILFKNTFESDHLASILDLARVKFMDQGDFTKAFAILAQLTTVPRLKVALMFLDKPQEEQVKLMFQQLAHSNTIDPEQFSKVLKDYHITL